MRAFRARRCSQHSTRCHSRRKNAVRRDSPRYSWGTASVSATFSLDVFKYGPKRRDCTQPGRTRLALIVNAGHSTTNDCFAGVLGDVRFWPVVARHRRISAHDRSGRCLGQEPHISHPGCLDAGGRGLRHRPRRIDTARPAQRTRHRVDTRNAGHRRICAIEPTHARSIHRESLSGITTIALPLSGQYFRPFSRCRWL